MVLRMKNFNILGVRWKIWLLGGDVHEKQYRGGGLPKKGAWTVCQFKGELGKREGVVFLSGVDNSMNTMRVVQNLKRNLFFVSKWQEFGEFWSEQ